MFPPTVEVAAPSRLHFGLFSFGGETPREFGGAGVMIDRPGIRLRIEPSDTWSVSGPHAARAGAVAGQLAEAWQLASLPACHLQIVSAAPDHVGLGTGTQLALSVAAGLNAWLGRPPLDAIQLALLTKRGVRSAIGTHGFLHGGLLVDAGKLAGEPLAALACRVPLPAEWRFVLISSPGSRGLHGEDERAAFGELPPVPAATADRLRQLACETLVPAAHPATFDAFSEGLYEFGFQAGMCFAPRQGGPFASSRIAALVGELRQRGVRGVGQSSWGPSVFALLADERSALELQSKLQGVLEPGEQTLLAGPLNQGAQVQVLPAGTNRP